MPILDELITKLRAKGQYLPTLKRYREHVEACEKSGVEPDTFISFANEVLNTPKDKREWLLSHEPIPNYEPHVRYAQYQSPRQDEIVTGLFYRDYRKGKK